MAVELQVEQPQQVLLGSCRMEYISEEWVSSDLLFEISFVSQSSIF